MPNRWCTNFINSRQSLHTSTLKAGKIFMVHQEQQTNTHQCKNKENNRRNGQGRNSTKRFRQNYNTNSLSRSSPAQGHSKKKKKRLVNNDDCSIHGPVHKWGQCHQNQYGEILKTCREPYNSYSNSHFTNTASRSSSYNRNIAIAPPSTQVYYHKQQQQRKSDSVSYLSTPSNTNYTDNSNN